jgi:hypothetical protein
MTEDEYVSIKLREDEAKHRRDYWMVPGIFYRLGAPEHLVSELNYKWVIQEDGAVDFYCPKSNYLGHKPPPHTPL